ncbi:sensor histidine kinase [Bacillus sp. SCS-153A]|uniref:HAMP domain-containing sensor histidine kinase n=1 Tax=Rossellomorea sedimentorum TaxID=3115294 RepID=UPI00390586DA
MFKDVLLSRSILIKLALIVTGITMPLWLGADDVGLTRLLEELKESHSERTLMLTALLLVVLNTIRALPHYIGAFLLGDEIGSRLQKPWLTVLLPIIIIPGVYFIINLYNPLNYSFGGPAIILLVFIILLHVFGRGRLRPVTKSFILAQVLFGVQWLDVVLFLSPYGFGQGPISSQVKKIAQEIGFDGVLSLYSVLLCSIFIINALVLAIYLAVSQQKWEMKQSFGHIQGEALQSRSGREVLHLVHDLKTPLATIEGLNSLIEMKTDDAKIKEYTNHISASIQSTSSMVSEILYEDKKNWCTLHNLIDYIRANRLTQHSITFNFSLEADDHMEIFINKIRLTRAIVNLIDNACDAVEEKEEGRVTLSTKFQEGQVWIGVSDNGKGMTAKEMRKIWNAGYSTKSHPGIGLSFVKSVAANHQAEIKIESKKGEGTTFWMIFSEEVWRRNEDIDYR